MTSVGLLSGYLRTYAMGGKCLEQFQKTAENPGYVLGEALDGSGFFARPIEAASDVEPMTGINPLKDPLMAAPTHCRTARTCGALASIQWADC